MPVIYLSPSTQEGNYYVTEGTEKYWMNRLADAMEPYLTASGIHCVRNSPDMSAATSIADSNRGSTICTWRSTPTPRRRVSTAPPVES